MLIKTSKDEICCQKHQKKEKILAKANIMIKISIPVDKSTGY